MAALLPMQPQSALAQATGITLEVDGDLQSCTEDGRAPGVHERETGSSFVYRISGLNPGQDVTVASWHNYQGGTPRATPGWGAHNLGSAASATADANGVAEIDVSNFVTPYIGTATGPVYIGARVVHGNGIIEDTDPTDSLPAGIVAIATFPCVVGPASATQILPAVAVVPAGPSASETQDRILSFMNSRANHILGNQPNIGGLFDGGNGGGPLGNMAFDGDDNRLNFAFSTSLSHIYAERARTLNMEASSTADYDLAVTAEPRKFDVWAEVYGARADAGNSSSNLWVAYAGAHYFVTPDLLVGAMGQFDWAEESNSVTNSDAEGEGWMIGPYIAMRTPDHMLTAEARVAWGQSDNEISPAGTYRDDFDTTRWLAAGKVSRHFNMGHFTVTPAVSVSYWEEKQEAYIDSLGTAIGEQTQTLGAVRFGPTLSRTIRKDDGSSITPTIGLTGVYNFSMSENDSSQGFTLGDDDLRARFDVGLTINTKLGWTFLFQSYFDGVGVSDYEAYGGRAKLTVPLH